MKSPKKKPKNYQYHTPGSPKGMGDLYGIGVRNPVGKMRSGLGYSNLDAKKLTVPPKSLA